MEKTEVVEQLNVARAKIEEGSVTGDDVWDAKFVYGGLFKGANPVALEGTKVVGKQLADDVTIGETDFSSTNPVEILELGCGAGWSTLLMIDQLIRAGVPVEAIKVTAVDNSPFAICTTAALLKQFGIECSFGDDESTKTVHFVQSNFEKFQPDKAVTYKAILSDHGIVYSTSVENITKRLLPCLVKGGRMYITSLNEFWKKLSTIFGKAIEIPFLPKMRGSKGEHYYLYQGDRRKIIAMNDKATGNFFNFLKLLLKNKVEGGKELLAQYKRCIGISTSVQSALVSMVIKRAKAITGATLLTNVPLYIDAVYLEKA